MARLYAATGDGIARLEESGEAWTVELSLPGSGVQCLAVDPADPTPSTPDYARAVCDGRSMVAEAGRQVTVNGRALPVSLRTVFPGPAGPVAPVAPEQFP
jgi:hypothetical protein